MGISKGKIKQENIDLFAWISGGSFIFGGTWWLRPYMGAMKAATVSVALIAVSVACVIRGRRNRSARS